MSRGSENVAPLEQAHDELLGKALEHPGVKDMMEIYEKIANYYEQVDSILSVYHPPYITGGVSNRTS